MATPIHLGKPWIYIAVSASKVYISNPREVSMRVSTISGYLQRSTIWEISLGHSIKVTLYFCETLIVTGPYGSKVYPL